jgi:hypothetical protein
MYNSQVRTALAVFLICADNHIVFFPNGPYLIRCFCAVKFQLAAIGWCSYLVTDLYHSTIMILSFLGDLGGWPEPCIANQVLAGTARSIGFVDSLSRS